MLYKINKILKNAKELKILAKSIAKIIRKNCLIYLKGQLGSGKTTFAKYFISALGYKGLVKSPSYNIVEYYELEEKNVYHFDFYRIRNSKDLYFIGWKDFLCNKSIIIVEWPEKGGNLMPNPNLEIIFNILYSKNTIKRSIEIIQLKKLKKNKNILSIE